VVERFVGGVKNYSAIWLARLLRSIDRAADILGIFNRPLLPEDLIALAQQRTGLTDFGEWPFREPFAVLLRAYQTEAGLTAFGRIAVRWDMVRYLSNLLRLRAEEKNDPAIIDEQIRAPIFLLGLPRSGTTFLHNLMAQDRANLTPLAWQTIYPYPLSGREHGNSDPRPRMVARQFAAFLRIAPELPSLHRLEANASQECIEITGQVVRSMRFDTTHYVPSYQRWLDTAGHGEAYRFHKRFLQHLQHQNNPGRWVLKSPDHIFAMKALLEVYPDARLVFVHRDPMRVLSSVAKLTDILREPFARKVDRLQIGRQVSERWHQGANLLIEASLKLSGSPGRIYHLKYRSLARDPLAAVAALYRHFGFALGPEAQLRMQHFIATQPSASYGRNIYHLEDYGLDREQERRRYQDYMSFFRIEPEDAADSISRRPDKQMAVRAAADF
jgi:Sulfotransferase family